MFCTNCGNELREQAKFCPKCGATVQSNADTRTTNPNPDNGFEKQSKSKENAGTQTYWQSAPIGPMQPQVLSTLGTLELIDGIVWAVIAGVQICSAFATMWASLVLDGALNIIGLGGLLAGSFLDGVFLLLIGALNGYAAYLSFKLRTALKWDPPLAVIAYYKGRLFHLIFALCYNLLLAPVGVLAMIYALVVRGYALSHEREIMEYVEKNCKDKIARGEKPAIFLNDENVLVQDVAIERQKQVGGIMYLTDQRIFWISCSKEYADSVTELAVFQNGLPQMRLDPPKKFRIATMGGKDMRFTLSGSRMNEWTQGIQKVFGNTSNQSSAGQQQGQAQGQGRFCCSCGASIPDGNAFCTRCGARQG